METSFPKMARLLCKKPLHSLLSRTSKVSLSTGQPALHLAGPPGSKELAPLT